MVCLISDIPNHRSAEAFTPASIPLPAAPQGATRIISMHERVVSLEKTNTRLLNRIAQLRNRTRDIDHSPLMSMSSNELIDGMLLMSIVTLVIVVGKLVFA